MKPFPFFLALITLTFAHAAPEERLVIGAEAGKGIAIVDPANDNEVLWRHPIRQVHDLHLTPADTILSQDGWTTLIEVDIATRDRFWTYEATEQNRDGAAKEIEIHAFQKLPDGNIMFAESGAARILEITPEGNLVKQFPLSVKERRKHSDTRLVRKLPNGHYLVAHEAEQKVKEYDERGRVLWEFDVPLFGKEPRKGHGPEAFGGKCFAAIQLKNGNYLIATGNGHSVLEVSPKKEIVWKLEQHDLEGITLAWVTNIEERDNGNLLIGNCHAGPDNPQIIEITRDKEVAWTFRDFETFGNSLANTIVVDGERALELRRLLAASRRSK